MTIFACYKIRVRFASNLLSHINDENASNLLQTCTWGQAKTTNDNCKHCVLVNIQWSAKTCLLNEVMYLFVDNLTYLVKLHFLLDILRSGATDQQKNADGKEENKKEVGLHAALKCPPTFCSRPGMSLIIVV